MSTTRSYPGSAIVFPRPPPTCNTLTPEERSKLLRSTAKLRQLLGSMPHVLDQTIDSPRQKPLPPLPMSNHSRRHRRSSNNEHTDWQKLRSEVPSSVSSCSSHSSTSSYSSFSSTTSGITSVSGYGTEEGWRIKYPTCRPPILQLQLPRPGDSFSNTDPYQLDGMYPDTETAPPPSFSIRTDASIKREKMRRLTKKLGEGVPVDLVFPPIAEEEDDDVLIHSPNSPASPSSTISSRSNSSSSTLTSVDSDSSNLKSRMRHEASHQPPRTSHFVKDLPDFPCQHRVLTVHYEMPEEYGLESETFEGLKRVVIPETRSRAPVTRKPVPSAF